MYLYFVCSSTSLSSNVVLLLAFSSTSLLRLLASHVKHEDWHNCWKIFYAHCFRPFSQKNQGKKEKRHPNPPQWIHIPLLCFFAWFVFFLCCCFFVAAFTLLAKAQRLIPNTGEKEHWRTICLESLNMS